MDYRIVIGKRFQNLSGLKHCISIGDVTESDRFVSTGVGLSEDERKYLAGCENSSSLTESHIINPAYMKDGRHPTHKEKEENILVNYVSQRTKTQYFAELMLDGNNEFLLDHVNGVHIPGLVFVESYPNEAHDLNSYKKTLCLWTKQGLFEEIEQKCSKYRLQEVWIICSSPGDRSTQSLITQVKECGAVPVTIQSLAQIPERIAGRRIGVLFAPIPKNKELLSIKSSLIQIAGREGTVCVSS